MDRPGQTTPPCVLGVNEAMIEIGLASWDRTATGGSDRVTDLALGASMLRFGVGSQTEVQLGWAGMLHSSYRDIARDTGHGQTDAGDMTIGFAHGLSGANGPVAVQGFVTLATGTGNATAGEWNGGLRVPVALDLGQNWQIGLTPEFDLAANASGHGHHVSFGGAAGLSHPVSSSLSAGIDVSLFEDRDPEGTSAKSTATASLAWQAGGNTQLDLGAGFGISGDVPGMLFYVGLAQRL